MINFRINWLLVLTGIIQVGSGIVFLHRSQYPTGICMIFVGIGSISLAFS